MSSGTSTGAGNVLVVGVLAGLGVDVDGEKVLGLAWGAIRAWIDIPSLQVIASDQYYSSVDAETVRYESGTRGVDVELEVDGDGGVVHYPDLARRV